MHLDNTIQTFSCFPPVLMTFDLTWKVILPGHLPGQTLCFSQITWYWPLLHSDLFNKVPLCMSLLVLVLSNRGKNYFHSLLWLQDA